MNVSHFQRAQRLSMARQREIQMLAQGTFTSDSRYVGDVVGWIWRKVRDRKLASLHRGLKPREYMRVKALAKLYRVDVVEGEYHGA